MVFFADLFGTPKPAPAVIIYNVLHEEIDRVEGVRDRWGSGSVWPKLEPRGPLGSLALWGSKCDGINLSGRTVTQDRLPNGITSRLRASVQLRSRCEFSWF
jgi:hypothetical protein